jgi:hypothetical protein
VAEGQSSPHSPSTRIGFVQPNSRIEAAICATTRTSPVPKSARPAYEAIIALTDAFCRDHLSNEYRELAHDVAAALCRKRPSPVTSGQARSWACGIIYALGQTNFLSDRSTQPHMTMADVCTAFGVSQSTGSARARVVSQALQVHRLNPRWCLPSLVDANPLVWIAELNGILVDLRHMPREVQEIAFKKGLIPYVPADRE